MALTRYTCHLGHDAGYSKGRTQGYASYHAKLDELHQSRPPREQRRIDDEDAEEVEQERSACGKALGGVSWTKSLRHRIAALTPKRNIRNDQLIQLGEPGR